MRSGSRPVTASPSNETLPFCGTMAPEMVFNTVVLPAPLAPRIVTTEPASTCIETPRIAMMGP